MAFPFITAEQAAELVNNGDNVGFSGFTAAGTPKFVAPAIAAKAKKEHEAGRPFKINVFTKPARQAKASLLMIPKARWQKPTNLLQRRCWQMPIDSGNLALKGLDDLFSTEENRQEEQREQVQQIPIGELHPFTNHPFKVVDDEAMTRTVESIAQFGVLAPLIARPRPDGDGYEIISGHRRQFAAKMAGLETLPVIVRNMDDDAATILMVDSNLQREHISPSERAFAYKMKMDAMKRTAGRPSKENSRQVVGNFETADLIGKESGESGRQVQRFIRLTNLIPELLNMVDEKKVSFNPAVELSYLSTEQQQEMINAMDDTQNAPSFSQAKRIKKLAQEGNFTSEAVVDIMGEEKKSELDTVTIKNEILRKYFPRSYTPKQMEEKIIQLLDAWQRKQQRQNER